MTRATKEKASMKCKHCGHAIDHNMNHGDLAEYIHVEVDPQTGDCYDEDHEAELATS